MKQKIFLWLASVTALLTLSSCFEVNSTISLKKDGSGTITEEMYFGEQMLGMIAMAAAQGGDNKKDPWAEILNEEQYKEAAKGFGEGVKFVKAEKVDADGKKGVRVTFSFADINKLVYSEPSLIGAMETNGAGKEQKGNPPIFKYADGKLDVTLPANSKEALKNKKGDKKLNEQEIDMSKQMLKDMHIRLKLKCVGGINKSSASFTNGDTVTLMDLDCNKLLADEGAMKLLADGAHPFEDAALFNKVDGVSAETKEKFSVELK